MNILNDILNQSTPIESLESIDYKSLKNDYINNKKPVVIKGFAKNWGATKKWDLDYLLALDDDKDISLLSGNFTQEDNRYKKSTFRDYILKLKDAELNEKTVDDYLTTMDIFNYFPGLNGDADFSIFEKCTAVNDVTAWIGPKGTISGFHNDTGKNLYAQIKGKKMFILSSTKFNKNLYPSNKYINGAVASQVDINNFTSEKFPNFLGAEFKSVVLEPGDVLYVPSKWWHYVQSLETSISISNFGYSNNELYTLRAVNFLHRRGLYKSKNCFCCKK
ncbi:cupin-like domain-containing protein [Arenibacter sp. BSSL-BM3]|uniref:Cupin-like domain-containing protein n=1 Tax=Arenibacter arenosicollis TaxID=2762274 RepID=A0ABR7QLP2_9FLAO|nr:cupin-like domain-containing protein [Arenibacter arenosicollis]MBC8767850.1 cupin-like domain-containing protein [Arenibacter arenosicollis]